MFSPSFLEISTPPSSRSASPTPVKAPSDEVMEDVDVVESQPMSIHKLDPKKIFSVFQMKISGEEVPLLDLIRRVVALYNQHLDESEGFDFITDRVHPLTEEPVVPAFRMAIFAKVTERTTRLAKWVHGLEPTFNAVTKKAEYVFFLYRYVGKTPHSIDQAEIFGLTTGGAWRVLEKFRDFSFPGQIARRWLKPELSGQTKRPLLGRVLMVDEIFKQETKPTKSEVIDQMFMRMKTYARPAASVFSLKFAEQKRAESLLFKLGIGMIRIERKAPPERYVALLDMCSRISRGEKTYQFGRKEKAFLKEEEVDSEDFDYLDFRQPASITDVHRLNLALDTVLWNAVTGKARLPILDFCHKFISDYFFSASYTLYLGKKQVHEWSKPLSAVEMVDMLRNKIPTLAQCSSVEGFSELLKQVEVGFSFDGKIKRGPFREYIEGEILLEDGSSFWRLRSMWYEVRADYLSLIQQEFCAMLKESLLPSDHPATLSKPFSLSESEPVYNRKYVGEKGIIFGDGVCPLNFELFDLAKVDDEEIYLIQVKRGLDKDIRTGASQIRSSAKNLKPKGKLNSSVLKKFFELGTHYQGNEAHRLQLKKELVEMGEKAFLKLFSKKIVFVYAVVDDVQTLHRLSLEKDLDLQMSAQRIQKFGAEFEKNSKGIFEELKKQDFLSKKGCPTTKFLTCTQDRFATEFSSQYLLSPAKKQLFASIKKQTSLIPSNVAKLELLRLKNDLEEMGFELRICEVPIESSKGAAAPGSVPATLRQLPDVDTTILYKELKEGDTFQFQGKPYKICDTKKDGACGLHALIGEPLRGVYEFTVPEGLKDSYSQIRELYWDIINKNTSKTGELIVPLFKDMLRQYLGAHPTPESRFLFGSSDIEGPIRELKEDLKECDQEWETISQQQEVFFNNLPRTCPSQEWEKILEKLRGDVSLEDFKTKYVPNPVLFLSICSENLQKIQGILGSSSLGVELEKIHKDKEEITLEKQNLMIAFLRKNITALLSIYKVACKREDYYFSDLELGMVALATQIKLTIVPHRLLLEVGDPITYGDEGEEVVIFHKGNHYSRCEREKKRKREE